jgi:hypothetical protein
MSLQISKVHVLERGPSGQDVLVKSNPYVRFVDQGGGSINIQGGKFYSNGRGQPTIPYEDVPAWVWDAVRKMTPEGREKVGMPGDMSDLPDEPVSEPEPDPPTDAQSLGVQEVEVEATLVDHIYSLDHSIDAHWTKAGAPDLNAVKELASKRYTRAEVEAAAPGYGRKET